MSVLMYPVATEKALGLADRNNVIVYIVDFRSKKSEIKAEFEKALNVKVAKINTELTKDNLKKAYIRLKKEYPATDIAKRLKLV